MSVRGNVLYSQCVKAVREITVGNRKLSDQTLKVSGQFRIMIGHDE